MACSGCAQRRAAITASFQALRAGNGGEAADRLKVVGRSAADDLRRLRDSAKRAALNRLARR